MQEKQISNSANCLKPSQYELTGNIAIIANSKAGKKKKQRQKKEPAKAWLLVAVLREFSIRVAQQHLWFLFTCQSLRGWLVHCDIVKNRKS